MSEVASSSGTIPTVGKDAAMPVWRTDMDDDRIMIDENEASRLTGLSVHWFRKRRTLGLTPRYHKIGSAVRYTPADLIAFRNEHTVETNEGASA